jgi:hypothetical protein
MGRTAKLLNLWLVCYNNNNFFFHLIVTADQPVPASNISSFSSDEFLGLWILTVHIVEYASIFIRYSILMVYQILSIVLTFYFHHF